MQSDSTARTAVNAVSDLFRANDIPTEPLDDGFSYDSGVGSTNVRAKAPQRSGETVGVSGVITIETELPEEARELSDDELSILNTMSLLSAFVRHHDGSVIAASRVSVYEGLESALPLQQHLVFGAALIQGESFGRAIRYLFQEEKELDYLPSGDEPGQWSAEEFKRIALSLDSVSTHSSAGVTVELPWAAGPKGTKRNALLTLAPAEHPSCGNGLRFALELPVRLAEDKLSRTLAMLNLRDYEEEDASPLFGAWSVGATESNPAFAGFIPNMLYRPSLSERITGWLLQRNAWAREQLG